MRVDIRRTAILAQLYRSNLEGDMDPDEAAESARRACEVAPCAAALPVAVVPAQSVTLLVTTLKLSGRWRICWVTRLPSPNDGGGVEAERRMRSGEEDVTVLTRS